MENTQKWYQKPLGIIVLLFLFFPVGLFLMWKYSNWSNQAKWIITGIVAVVVVISLFIPQNPPTEQETVSKVEPKKEATISAEEKAANEAEAKKKAEEEAKKAAEEEAKKKAQEEASKPKWVAVVELSGDSNKRSNVFTLEGGKQRLSYTLTGNEYVLATIYVVEEGKELLKDGGFPEASPTGPGSDSTFLYKSAGKYYLDITAGNGSWTVKIEEER